MKKFLNALLVIIVAGIMVGGFVHTVFLPVDINEYENRYANKVASFSLSSYLDGSFQDSIETALADQIPFSEELKKDYNAVNSAVVKQGLNYVLAENEKRKEPEKENENLSSDTLSALEQGQKYISEFYGLSDNSKLKSALGIAPGETLFTTHKLTDGTKYIRLAGNTYMFGGDHLCVFSRNVYGNDLDVSAKNKEKNIAEKNAYSFVLDRRAFLFNNIFKDFQDLDFYAYYIRTDTDVNMEEGKNQGVDNYFLSQLDLPRDHMASFDICCFNEFDNLFYKTDHHWNYKGSYYGYLELAKLLNVKGSVITPKTDENGNPIVITLGEFSGSRANGVGTGYSEAISMFTFDFPKTKTTLSGIPGEYGNQESFPVQYEKTGTIAGLSYGRVYGYDTGEIIIENIDPACENLGGNILVIGESYDNAIIKLLASHYSKLVSIDLRNYKAEIGKSFDLSDCVSAHNIDTVLLIGSQSFWISTDFIVPE